MALEDEPGLWLVDEVPDPPHPNDLCFLTAWIPSVDESVAMMIAEIERTK